MASRNGENSVSSFQYANPAEIWAIGTVLPATCIAIVGLRFWARLKQGINLGKDDWLMLCGLTCLVGMGICFIIGVAVGYMGYPTPPLPPGMTAEEALSYAAPGPTFVGKMEFAIQMLNVICYGFVKLSIIFFYRRVFVVNKRTPFDLVTKIVGWVCFLWTITFILIIIFPCGSHVADSWGVASEQLKYCMTIGYTSLVGLAASDLILDVVLILLPIPEIWRLHMKRSRKVAVTGIMLLGAAAVGSSVARLVLYVQTQSAKEQHVPVDFDQVITLDMYWSMVECGLAVIAACLPTLSYFFNGFSLSGVITSARSLLSLNRRAPQSGAGTSQRKSSHADSNGSTAAKNFDEERATDSQENFDLEALTPAAASQAAVTTPRNRLEV